LLRITHPIECIIASLYFLLNFDLIYVYQKIIDYCKLRCNTCNLVSLDSVFDNFYKLFSSNSINLKEENYIFNSFYFFNYTIFKLSNLRLVFKDSF
jgi:hypothetical protein